MKKDYLTAFKLIIGMTVLTGFLYPVTMTITARLIFPWKAGGSLIMSEGKIMGSALLGQKFDSTIYFWSRPSSSDYGTVPSGASNLGPTSQALLAKMHERRADFVAKNYLTDSLSVPPDMLFASGSGVDPHISPASALLQVRRISEARHLDEKEREELNDLINELTEPPQFGILGESRINVLRLNMELDKLYKASNVQ